MNTIDDPVHQVHDTDSPRDCWCGPRIEQLCWLCGGENDGSAESDLPCSACGGTRWLPAYSDDADTPTVVIHNVVA